ncbi:BAZ2B, partial [Cervus elaphus hippelaphus]
EKERLKQEKRDEKRLNKERKLEQRRLELEMAKELKKPNEDMCLADQKPLPELPRIPGLVLSGSTFSDCLMVVQFLRNFGKVLGFDVNIDVPNLSVLQEGLLNIGDSMGEVQDLLVRLLSAAVCDPGLITGYKAKTALGEHLLNVGVNRDNVSEILQIFMEAHCGQTELTESLKTKAFQAHTPAQKASVLAFLINELACSKSVVSEIDKNIDYMSNLRRDKWVVEGKLRKKATISHGNGHQQSQYRRKLFDASHSLRSMMFGQDRYRRRYWILPQCGGIFVEGMESGEGLEEIAKEREKLKKAKSIQIKEEIFETSEDTLNCSNPDHCEQKEDTKEKDNTNLFLQKPGSFSKLSKLLEVAKMPPESDVMTPKPNSSANGCTLSYQNSGKHSLGSIQSTATQSNMEKTDSNNLFNTSSGGPGKFCSPLPNDQLLKTLTEKNRQWFSLLPRTPCDDTSLTHADVSTASSVTPQSQPLSKSPSPTPAPLLGSSAQNPVGLNPFALSPLQFGWWRIIDPEDLKALLKVLHLRGIREKALQKQIQKHLDYITQACIKNKDEPASEREDLVYFEHKSFSKLCKEHDGEFTGEEESSAHALERKSDNPLDIAVTRLADLERNIERRYLKSPLSTTIQIKLDNVGTVTVPAPAPSISGDGDGIEEDIAPGLRVWRRALSEARSAAQVALCIQQLQKSIAWEKSIMKVYCQICRKGDNEELLLLCDGCDKGFAIIELNENEENQVTRDIVENWSIEEQAMEMDLNILQQ